MTTFVTNPCTQEKRALERKLSEMEEEMKVGMIYSLDSGFMLCLNVFGIVTQERDIKGARGKGPVFPLSVFLHAVRTYFNGRT